MNEITGEKTPRAFGPLRAVSPLTIALGTSLWILAFDNLSFWKTFLSAQPGKWSDQVIAAAGLALVLVFALSSVFRPLAGARAGRVLMAVIVLLSGAVAHYMDAWGIVIDRNMIRNISETDVREVSELFAWSALSDITLRGGLPALLLLLVPIHRLTRTRMAMETLALLGATAVATAALLFLQYGTLATTFRNHRELRLQLVPSNYVKAVHSYFKGVGTSSAAPQIVAADAVRSLTPSSRPRVLVLMVGETARAANFSLGGYARSTNSHLSKSEITYFSSVTSCGTDTATSLPCMFSNIGARDFNLAKAKASENVLDVLVRAGVQVTWLENNSGCKGVCARVPTLPMPKQGPAAICGESGCQDEVLIDALAASLARVNGDSLLVMHLMGSHGPSYFKRYPAPGPFQPTCDTNRIQTCEREALINTYDNTIDYTSKVIAQAIDVAQSYQNGMDISLIYISDHGESLGERNIYLHGLPPSFAPREQLDIPMIGWLSPPASVALKVSASCLSSLGKRPLSHDNLFHTLLGYHGISTATYRAELDLFAMAQRLPACAPTLP